MKQVLLTIAIITLGFAANAQAKGHDLSLENATEIVFQNTTNVISNATAEVYSENINRFKKDAETVEVSFAVNYVPEVTTVNVAAADIINALVKGNNACYTATSFAIVANSNSAATF